MLKLWRHISVTCLVMASSGFYSNISNAGFNSSRNTSLTPITPLLLLSNVSGNGTGKGSGPVRTSGHTPFNGTNNYGDHKNASFHTGNNRQTRNESARLDANRPSAPGKRSSLWGKNGREKNRENPAPRRKRQAEPTPLSSPQNFTQFDCNGDSRQTANIDFSKGAPAVFPLCRQTQFSGHYNGDTFGLENLHIKTNHPGGVFLSAKDASIHANLFNVTIESESPYGSGALIAHSVRNEISMTGDVSVTTWNNYAYAGAYTGASDYGPTNLNQTDLKATVLTSGDFSYAGAGIGWSAGIYNNVRMNQRDLNVNISSSGSYGYAGAGIGRSSGRDADVSQRGLNATISTSGYKANAGVGIGTSAYHGANVIQRDIHATVSTSGEKACAGAGIGLLANFDARMDQRELNATVSTSNRSAHAGAGIGFSSRSHANVIQSDVHATVSTSGESAYAGVGIGYSKGSGITKVTQRDVHATVSTSSSNAYAGAGMGASTGNNTRVTQRDVYATVSTSGQQSHAGLGTGDLQCHSNTLEQTDVHATVHTSGFDAVAGGGFGRITGINNALSQTAVRLNISSNQSTCGSAFGRLSDDSHVKIMLYSGDAGGIPICGFVGNNAAVSGFVDSAGYNADPTSCQGTHGDFHSLNSTKKGEWRTVHNSICPPGQEQKGSCHSPHEQLLTLASGSSGSVYLVSEQRYPFKESSDHKGLVRVVRLQQEANSTSLVPDQSFGVNGSVLLNAPTTEGSRNLLRGLPVSQQVNATHLTSLYALQQENTTQAAVNQSHVIQSNATQEQTPRTGAALVHFPLNEGDDVVIQPLPQLAGYPLLVDHNGEGDNVWMGEQKAVADNPGGSAESSSGEPDKNTTTQLQVIRYLVQGTHATEEVNYDLNSTYFPDDNVVAINKDKDYLYTARQSDSEILLERYMLDSGQHDNWMVQATLPDDSPLVSDTNTSYALSIKQAPFNSTHEQRVFELLPLGTAVLKGQHAPGLRVVVPEYGGEAALNYFTPERIVADRFARPTDSKDDTRLPTSLPTSLPTTLPTHLPTSAPSNTTNTLGDNGRAIAGGVVGGVAVVAGLVGGSTCIGCAVKHKDAIKKKIRPGRKRFKKTWKSDQKAAQEQRFEMEQGTLDG